MIQIQNLKKKYGGTVIFENASFSFPDKGLVCVLGPSGCGKSTLLNLIAGFDSEYEGELSVHGNLLSGMNFSELCAYRRDNIGFVFQNYHLISGYTVLENVLLATDAVGKVKEESISKAETLLQRLGLSDKVNQRIETLSGGQKQRTAIARALINNPSVILADEPTGALDRKNSDEIMKLLKDMAQERLVLVITHDKKCAEYAERVVTIHEGKLTCENLAGDKAETPEKAVLKQNKAPKPSLWKWALKNFKVHMPRYLAIALSVSIGVLCFSLSLSSGNIMEQSVIDFRAKNTAFHNGYIKAEGKEEELLSLLCADERLENVYPQYILKDISLKIGEQTEAMAEKYPMAKAVEQMSYGVMPRRNENEIAISPSLAAKFDKNIQNLIGQTIELTCGEKKFSLTVSGIFNASYDDFFVSSDVEQTMYQGASGEVYSVSYDVVEFEEIVTVSEGLEQQGITSQNASDEVGAFLNTFQNISRLFWTVSGLVFVIGVFISAILLVKQQNTRFREVGLLSALGFTRGSIRKILFYENLMLAATSVFCSMILTVLAVGIGKTADFALSFTVPQMLFSLCLTGILILVISLGAGVRLIRTEPAEALRK